MFAEARLALEHGIPVVWVGARRPLSGYRPGVIRVDTLEAGVDLLATFAEIVSHSWGVGDAWARATIWDLITRLERGANAEVAHAAA
jgi:hypothetical protein